ncbi:hypothetical protein BRW65_20935 [Mycobacterium paraffinicum]|uniref:Uncharacterized protein n=1 Tax=Mycobacterium paraffinicum TaxID=53378 RepID=A0A1Q4HQJ9_9MYCO|nr:hypothetical protein BRW65_20935 [Mycobacterium paraffinicum]
MTGRTGKGAIFTIGAAGALVVGAAVGAVVDVVGEAGCRVEWQPHASAKSSPAPVSQAAGTPTFPPPRR